MTFSFGPAPTAERAPKPGIIPLRPLTAGEILAAGIAVVRRHFLILGPIAALFSLLAGGAQLWVLLATGWPASAEAWTKGLLGNGNLTLPAELLAAAGAALLVSMVTSVLLTGPASVYVAQDVLSRPTGAQAVLGRMKGRWPVLLGVAAAVGGLVAVGLALFAVPGILLYLAWLAAAPISVMEGGTVRTAVSRSTRLTSGHRGRLFGVTTLTVLAGAVIGIVIDAIVVSVLGADISATTSLVVGTFVGAAVASVTGAWTAAVTALLYVDLRIRKEGLAESLAAAAHRDRMA